MTSIATQTIKIVLVEDHKITRFGISTLLSTKADLQVCGEAATAAEGLNLVELHQPDIVIIDINLPDKNGLELTEEIKYKYSNIKVIVLSGETQKEIVKSAFGNGADSYCSKLAEDEKLLEAVYATSRGESWVDSKISKPIVEEFRTNRKEVVQFSEQNFYQYMLRPDRLTAKELEVLQLICAGMSNEEIATNLCISPGTVRTHTHKIFQKLNVNSRTQAMRVAIERGLVDTETIARIRRKYNKE
ncbi:MAG: Transcriptional regulatory protein DegU [Chroococcidiopsis cubana SAG 39.79]|uniref:DNA-binding response regulator n=1 Tax=Chroococcidiopsis cubana SAG 39.79 TaxID=388085 RepID=A0AB37UTG2_9CYAN|nr:response regulator transcription factor [Chroococcidiopsis cubana]MDZ4878201.1 Transcriptional regulatory protein DegU [Chroococcidiopsis cubana SAG 39.79]PSB66575.1 DNA-binding response regulator [Chroococcidiopsis cubana CCALA 043]RUT14537.1 DNA-binding response regulator [Chroococcidiopsis cubana SAG 39.79]